MTAEILARQRAHYESGATRDVRGRIAALKKLRSAIGAREGEILAALKADLGKSATEAYMTEIGMTLRELNYMIRRLPRLARAKTVRTPLALFPGKSRIYRDPYGCVLMMSPWNYPFLLTMSPVIAAVAAGNVAMVKPSAYAPHTGEVIKSVLADAFAPEHVSVALGGRAVNSDLLEQPFDYIFFTGGKEVGRLVLERASRHLTPATLELGGKSPCIVDDTADIALAARRIAFGKFLNAGQTCVAPDYVLVHRDVRDALIDKLRDEIAAQFGQHPLENPDYGKIINERHHRRLIGLIEPENVLIGGEHDEQRIAPTVVIATLDSPCMQEEIFGPILPILTFSAMTDVYRIIAANPDPLALYLFTASAVRRDELLARARFGGGCVNDTIMHLATDQMGFGGVGQSGMGSYHGRRSFDAFSREKSVLHRGSWLDPSIRYQPYTDKKWALMRRFF